MATEHPTILVIDDDPALRKLLQRDLEMEGYRVMTARNGEMGLEMIRSLGPELVLLDIMMPGMDGFEVCERARQFTNVPIIMLTVKGQPDDMVRGMSIGATEYVTKPFHLDRLFDRIGTLLAQQ